MKHSQWLWLVAAWWLGAVVLLAAEDEPQPRPRPGNNPRRMNPAQMLTRFDKNNDGFLQRDECPQRMQDQFEQFDADSDGKLNRDELQKALEKMMGPAPPAAAFGPAQDGLFRLLDTNGDERLSKEELEAAPALLLKLDQNEDGELSREELAAARPTRSTQRGRPGEVITPAAKGERHQDQLQVGDDAPDFTLPAAKGKKDVTLSSFQGRPVVLVFGSYT